MLAVENGLLRAGIGHPAPGLLHFARLLFAACLCTSISLISCILSAHASGPRQRQHPAQSSHHGLPANPSPVGNRILRGVQRTSFSNAEFMSPVPLRDGPFVARTLRSEIVR